MANKGHIFCSGSELDYSTPKLIQSDIEMEYFSTLTPKNTIIPGNPLTFVIDGGSDFVDLSRTMLNLQVKISDADGGPLLEADACAPINNVLHSMFSQVSVSLRDCAISHPNPNYPYRAYFENLLNFGAASKSSWMQNFGFFQDQATKFDAQDNRALGLRRARLADGRIWTLRARPHTDIGFQKRLLPSNLDIKLVLSPSRKEFVMQNFSAAKDFTMEIISASLVVRKVKLYPTRQIAFEHQISKSPIRLPMAHVQIKSVSIAAGLTSFSLDSLYAGKLPRTIICGLVDNDAYTGDIKKSPFNFKHFSLDSIQLRKNGVSIPTTAISADFEGGNVTEAYETLFKIAGTELANSDNGLTQHDFINGSSIYGFPLNNGTSCPHDDIQSIGNVDIVMKFKVPLPNTVSLVLYGQFDSTLVIDKHRNVIFDQA